VKEERQKKKERQLLCFVFVVVCCFIFIPLSFGERWKKKKIRADKKNNRAANLTSSSSFRPIFLPSIPLPNDKNPIAAPPKN